MYCPQKYTLSKLTEASALFPEAAAEVEVVVVEVEVGGGCRGLACGENVAAEDVAAEAAVGVDPLERDADAAADGAIAVVAGGPVVNRL